MANIYQLKSSQSHTNILTLLNSAPIPYTFSSGSLLTFSYFTFSLTSPLFLFPIFPYPPLFSLHFPFPIRSCFPSFARVRPAKSACGVALFSICPTTSPPHIVCTTYRVACATDPPGIVRKYLEISKTCFLTFVGLLY